MSERIKDPSNYVTILTVMGSVLLLYCLVMVWARRRDIKDEGKVSRGLCAYFYSAVETLHRFDSIVDGR